MGRIIFFYLVIMIQTFHLPAQRRPQDIDWQGHRGCRGLRPENSIPAFLHALTFPQVTTLEMDVVISRDKMVVVSHEPWFNPLICDTNIISDNNLYHTDYELIKRIDCGYKGHTRFPQQMALPMYKPTLREVVTEVRKYCEINGHTLPALNIEIKSYTEWDGKFTPPVAEFCDLVLAEFINLGLTAKSNIQSFDVRALKYVRETAPQVRLAFLVENKESWKANLNKLGFTPDIYSPHFGLITRSDVRELHAKGMKVIPWTVNDAKVMHKLIRWGVDGIITDYPNLIAEVAK